MSELKILCPDYVERIFTATDEHFVAGGQDDDSVRGFGATSHGCLYACQVTPSLRYETWQWDNGGDSCVMDLIEDETKKTFFYEPKDPLRRGSDYASPACGGKKDYFWVNELQHTNRYVDFGNGPLSITKPNYRLPMTWVCNNYSLDMLIAFAGIEDDIFYAFTNRYGELNMQPGEIYEHPINGELLFNFVIRFYARAIYAVRDLLFKQVTLCKISDQGCGYYTANCSGSHKHVYDRCGENCEIIKKHTCTERNDLLCTSTGTCQYKIAIGPLEAGLIAEKKGQVCNPGTLKSAIMQSLEAK
jgi:hypothetical protein